MPALLRARDGVLRLRARRIDHADQPGEDEVLFDTLVRAGGVLGECVGCQPAAGDAERAQRLAGQRFVDLQNLAAARVGCERPPAVTQRLRTAQRVSSTSGAPLVNTMPACCCSVSR